LHQESVLIFIARTYIRIRPTTASSKSTNSTSATSQRKLIFESHAPEPVFWRVEGSLLNLTAVRPVAFFTWNAQSLLERSARRGAMGVLAVARPVLYASNRLFALM
jgi:hypothetical protein